MNIKLSFIALALLAVSLSTPLTTVQAQETEFQSWIQSNVIQTQLDSLAQRIEALSQRLTASLSTATASSPVTVVVEGATITKQSASSPSQALSICHEHAYNPDYMWLVVECVYNDKVIYSDVFIAG